MLAASSFHLEAESPVASERCEPGVYSWSSARTVALMAKILAVACVGTLVLSFCTTTTGERPSAPRFLQVLDENHAPLSMPTVKQNRLLWDAAYLEFKQNYPVTDQIFDRPLPVVEIRADHYCQGWFSRVDKFHRRKIAELKADGETTFSLQDECDAHGRWYIYAYVKDYWIYAQGTECSFTNNAWKSPGGSFHVKSEVHEGDEEVITHGGKDYNIKLKHIGVRLDKTSD